MVDLIRTAYAIDADKILGGPSWLEMDRFDVLAELPSDATPETENLMLQSLLAGRFKLVLHKDTKPFPAYALTLGKKPQLRPAVGAGDAGGCGLQPVSAPPGSGRTVQYSCRNTTMAAFAGDLHRAAGALMDPNPVLDRTGLNGRWNFDLTFSPQSQGLRVASVGGQVTLSGAIDQQLGLKLEAIEVPVPVIVVDSVNRKPSPNPPDVAEALPPIPVPTKFAVASVKPSGPNERGVFDTQPGGRVTIHNQPMSLMIDRAFHVTNNGQIVAPKWANTAKFDIDAEADMPAAVALDDNAMRPMMLALLVDRFKMAYHTEERPVTMYSLVPAKLKMKKADPASRTWCKYLGAPPGSPPATLGEACQNITMAQFAERLRSIAAGGLDWPVTDGTGLDGGWDFTLVFIRSTAAFGARQAGPASGDVPVASDPSVGYTIFEALEKELGLKLEIQKRPMPVIVIDRLEEKPTPN